MLRSLDLNTAAERSSVQGFTLQTVARLSPNDAVLPQVLTVCDMVKRGIGVVSIPFSLTSFLSHWSFFFPSQLSFLCAIASWRATSNPQGDG